MLLRRSPFHQTVVWQLVGALEANDWVCNDMLQGRIAGLFGSQIDEDFNNAQNNDKSLTGASKAAPQHYLCPEVSYAAAINRGVCDKIHRYKPVPVKSAVVRPSAPVPEAVCKRDAGALPRSSFVSTKQDPPFYSATAEHFAIPTADLAILRKASGAAMGCIWEFEHSISSAPPPQARMLGVASHHRHVRLQKQPRPH